jgi:ABC-type molybdate transport system substrate-binding protein
MTARDLPEIPPERGDDLQGLQHADEAELVLFMAGNQFMALPGLVAAFRRAHPEVGRIFYETLPPGLELRQILAGGARFQGRRIAVPPDVYTTVSPQAVRRLAAAGLTSEDQCFVYLRNRLAIMVPAANPAGVRQVADLGREGVRVSQPDPEHENIAEHVLNMYRAAGGEELVRRITRDKAEAGETSFTTVHHRQTPDRLLSGRADAGPVWATEVAHAREQGLALDGVEPGPELDQRDAVEYFACPVFAGRNQQAGRSFLEFLGSAEARSVFQDHGFTV